MLLLAFCSAPAGAQLDCFASLAMTAEAYVDRLAIAARTRSGVKGTTRILAPVASKIALVSAAATGAVAASPAPRGGSVGRSISAISSFGTSGIFMIG